MPQELGYKSLILAGFLTDLNRRDSVARARERGWAPALRGQSAGHLAKLEPRQSREIGFYIAVRAPSENFSELHERGWRFSPADGDLPFSPDPPGPDPPPARPTPGRGPAPTSRRPDRRRRRRAAERDRVARPCRSTRSARGDQRGAARLLKRARRGPRPIAFEVANDRAPATCSMSCRPSLANSWEGRYASLHA